MSTPVPVAFPCCTREEVRALVAAFYARVRRDPVLGPVFARHVADWAEHEARLSAFWNGLLRGESGFSGAPLPRHLAIDGLDWPMFERWLQLFGEVARAQGNPAMARLATERAGRIAEHFWRHYRARRGI